MPQVIPFIGPVVGAATSLFGAKKQADAQDQALQQAQAIPLPSSVRFDGLGATGIANRTGAFTQLDNPLEQIRQGAIGQAGNFLGNVGGAGPSGATNQAFSAFANATGAQPGLNTRNLGSLESQAISQANAQNSQLGALQQFGFQRDLQGGLFGSGAGSIGQAGNLFGAAQGQFGAGNSFFGQAADQFGRAAGGFQGLRDETLANLRSLAAPHEQRAFNTLQDRQFASGRLGTTGGGIQTEAFARGLGQADTSRILAANEEARRAGQFETGVGQAFQGLGGAFANTGAQLGGLAGQQGGFGLNQIGQGQNLAGLENTLLNSAFSRFGQTAGLGARLNDTAFGRAQGQSDNQFERADRLLNQSRGQDLFGGQLQQQQFGLANEGLGIQSGLFGQGMSAFDAALKNATIRANANNAQASNTGALVGSAGFDSTPGATAISDIFAELSSSGALDRLRNRAPRGTDTPVPNDLGI